jgi:hypothetical protein
MLDATDKQVEILDAAHKAEAEKRGATITFFCRTESLDCCRIFSETTRGGFWSGINPYSEEVFHLWYPCEEFEMDRFLNLVQPKLQ